MKGIRKPRYEKGRSWAGFDPGLDYIPKTKQESMGLGFIELNNFPNYLLNKEGIVLNFNEHKNIKTLCRYYIDIGGYFRVWLKNKNNKKQFIPIHRLLGLTFLKRKDPSQQINHIDGNRQNNSLSNLEWVSFLENERHSRRVLGKVLVGEKHSQTKLKTKDVLRIKKLLSAGVIQRIVAKKFNISEAQIGRIKRGVNWGHLNENN